MEEWKEYRLGDFMEFNPKRSLSKNTIARKITMDKLVPHTRDIYDWTYEPYSGGAKFQNGDTLMARITPCLENGKQAYVGMLNDGETAFGSTEYIVICGRKSLCDNRFAYYLSLCPTFRNAAIKSMVGTSGRQRAQVDVLENMVMRLPPVPVQLNIVHILSSLDDKIDLNRKINSNLEEQAKALFNSWFIDFEPFKGGKFVDSELGKIPDGWNMRSFESFISESQDKAMVGTYPAYSVTNNGITPRTEKFKKQLSKATSKEKILRKDDLVFGMSRQILNWGIMQDEIGSVSSAYHVYKIDKGKTDPTYLRYFIKGYESYFRDLIGTAAREGQSLDKGALMNKKLLVPSKDILRSFIQHVTTIENAKNLFKSQCRRLSTLRDTLLPRLMSGEIEVRS
jgi:type I restriction enzyme S subunit